MIYFRFSKKKKSNFSECNETIVHFENIAGLMAFQKKNKKIVEESSRRDADLNTKSERYLK